MKLWTIAFVLLALARAAPAQIPGGNQMPTRLVMLFSNIENQLNEAMASASRDRASSLLTDDFEEWTPQPPGSPTPREEWLKSAGKDLAKFRIRQMAAKGLGDHVVVNFVLTTKTEAFFVVDVWQKAGTDWQLATRYLAPVDPSPYRGDARPTRKD
jgi:Domain of unknown function (DUF4440)